MSCLALELSTVKVLWAYKGVMSLIISRFITRRTNQKYMKVPHPFFYLLGWQPNRVTFLSGGENLKKRGNIIKEQKFNESKYSWIYNKKLCSLYNKLTSHQSSCPDFIICDIFYILWISDFTKSFVWIDFHGNFDLLKWSTWHISD